MAAEKKKEVLEADSQDKAQNKDGKKPSFEEGCKRLEEIVAALSGGNVTLEKNIELYAEGSKILKDCLEMLEEAKGVIRLVEQN